MLSSSSVPQSFRSSFCASRLPLVLGLFLICSSVTFGQGRGRGGGPQGNGGQQPNNNAPAQGSPQQPNNGGHGHGKAQGPATDGPAQHGGQGQNAEPGAHVGPPFRPPGWDKGKKVGWGGSDIPPGLEKKAGGVGGPGVVHPGSAGQPAGGAGNATHGSQLPTHARNGAGTPTTGGHPGQQTGGVAHQGHSGSPDQTNAGKTGPGNPKNQKASPQEGQAGSKRVITNEDIEKPRIEQE